MKPPASVKTLFISEQRKPLHRSTVNLLLKTASAAASLPFAAHPHMLRHACGFALADQGARIISPATVASPFETITVFPLIVAVSFDSRTKLGTFCVPGCQV